MAVRYPNMPQDNRVQRAVANPGKYFAEAWLRARDEIIEDDREEAAYGRRGRRRARARAILDRAGDVWRRGGASSPPRVDEWPQTAQPRPRGSHSGYN